MYRVVERGVAIYVAVVYVHVLEGFLQTSSTFDLYGHMKVISSTGGLWLGVYGRIHGLGKVIFDRRLWGRGIGESVKREKEEKEKRNGSAHGSTPIRPPSLFHPSKLLRRSNLYKY
jgi:hypothetical protein